MVTARDLPSGVGATLFEVDSLRAAIELHSAMAAAPLEGVGELVPAARTVLVRFDPGLVSAAAVREWVARLDVDTGRPVSTRAPVELDISYDGADVADTAALLGMSVQALLTAHRSALWTVAFTGFAPGFGYLVSDDWQFDVPRLESPRTRVPAGAVGLAGEFTGAYPRATPGGWRLIGNTVTTLFDPHAHPPTALTPGSAVRFRATRERAVGAWSAPSATIPPTGPATPAVVPGSAARTSEFIRSGTAPSGAADGRAALLVIEPGLLATVQDTGRPGNTGYGVAASGAADQASLRTANRLVGNPQDAAAIEVTMGGFRARTDTDTWIAVAGAWGPLSLDGSPIDPYHAHAWPAGTELRFGWFEHGARAYLAVRGGIGGDAVLGSRSCDTLAGLGPPPLAAGDALNLLPAPSTNVPVPEIEPWGAPQDDSITVEVTPGPRADWFSQPAREAFYDAVWAVTDRADRIGIRLDGPVLDRITDAELPSEAMIPGGIQVPPVGLPTVLMADAPVTGGYPVIAVATRAGIDRLAQARAGTLVRFHHAH